MAIEAGAGLVPPVTPAKAPDNPNPGNPDQGAAAGDQGDKGSEPREWMKDLPEPLKAHKTLAKFTDQEWKASLAKSYVELEGKLGKSLVVPDDNAGAEEWGKVYSRLGRPEAPEKYEIPTGSLDAEFEGIIRKQAFEDGASQKVVSGVVKAIRAGVDSAMARAKAAEDAEKASVEARRLETAATLRKEMGADYDRNIAAANNAIKTLFPGTLAERLTAQGFMDDPDFLRAFSIVGSEMGETGLLLGKPNPASKDPYDWMRKAYGNRE
jgi:hypothetical protein